MIDAYLMRARRTSNHQSRHIVSTSPSSTTSCSSFSSPSQQFTCSPRRLIQLNAETPRRLAWPLRSFIPPLPLSRKSLQPTFPTIAIRSTHSSRLGTDHALSPSPTLRTKTPLPFAPRATSAPRRPSLDPSTHSRSASTPTLSWSTSTSLTYPDTSLLFDGHSGIPI